MTRLFVLCTLSFRLASRQVAALLVVAVVGVVAQADDSPVIESEGGAVSDETMFLIPAEDQTYEELMAIVDRIANAEPGSKGEAEMLAFQTKAARTVVAVGEKALKLELDQKQAMQSTFYRLQGLRMLEQLRDPDASENLASAVEEALLDERQEVAAVGIKFFVESGFGRWDGWGKDERVSWIGRIVKHAQQRGATVENLRLVLALVDFLGEVDGQEFAKQLLAELLPLFKNSAAAEVRSAVGMLEGINRRLNLPGNKIELDGTLLDGSPLAWSEYRGKVVLVDFWATWCGPCRAEIPNVMKMYDAYHDKGFDVLGISLDSQAEQAESYIKEAGIRWATLFGSEPAQRGWKHPMAVKYGITGIPRAILVNREGKVVNMNARGPVLERELRRLLGEPLARAQSAEAPYLYRVARPIGNP